MADDRCDLLCLDLDVAERIRKASLSRASLQHVSERVKALADPTRLSIASALSEADELCGCDLAWIVGRSQGLVSHHLRTLHVAALVEPRRDGKMVLYRLTPAGRALVASVLATEVAHA